MFDFAWSEIALIAGVALILIGPKDMPAAIRTVTAMVKKARRMASEFQTHVDEMVREANLDEVRSQFNEIRNFDVRSHVEKAIDPDGSLSKDFDFGPTPAHTVDPLPEVTVEAAPAVATVAAPDEPEDPGAPAFIPPNMVPKPVPKLIAQPAPEAPAFIPPSVVLQQRSHPPS
jgi:sec-independent protein translocase protein TatB